MKPLLFPLKSGLLDDQFFFGTAVAVLVNQLVEVSAREAEQLALADHCRALEV